MGYTKLVIRDYSLFTTKYNRKEETIMMYDPEDNDEYDDDNESEDDSQREGAEIDCPNCGGEAIMTDTGVYCPDCANE